MSTRRSKLAVSVLLLISAIFLGAQQYFHETPSVAALAGVTISPSYGPPGQFVNVTGSGFSGLDNTWSCSITGTGGVVKSQACAVQAGQPRGNFTVAIVAAVPYTITLTATKSGQTSQSAQGIFTVMAGPTIFINPTKGPPGTFVNVFQNSTSTPFPLADTTCTLNGDGSIIKSSSCVISNGNVNGTSFYVSNVAPGPYRIWVHGSQSGLNAYATFNVTSIALGLTLTPSNATTGSTVTFRGTGFSVTDTSCTVSSSPTNLLIGSYTCSISSRVATGSFVVGSLATANVHWIVRVTGSPVNDNATADFGVLAKISVTPTTGSNGTVASVSGSGFSSLATSCKLLVVPNISTAFRAATCGVAGSGYVAGSFIVNSTTPGVYLVNVTDNDFHDGHGYFAGTTFTIGTPNANIRIIPNVVAPGDSVAVVGDGFNPGDTACEISPGVSTSGTPTCSASGGVVAASFKVNSGAASGYYIVVIKGKPYGDFAPNILEVTVTTITTTTSTSTTTSVTTTTATSITTSISSTLTTTSITNTGVSTYKTYTFTTTTATGQSTASITTTTTATSMITTITTTTTSTTVALTYTLGQAIAPSSFYPQDFNGNLFGLISLMTLLGWVLIRRLAF